MPEESNPVIIEAPAPRPLRTCGTCDHAVRIDINQITCYGVPPTPVMMAAGQDRLGRPAVQMSLMRPNLPANERACSLWKFAIAQSQDLKSVPMGGKA